MGQAGGRGGLSAFLPAHAINPPAGEPAPSGPGGTLELALWGLCWGLCLDTAPLWPWPQGWG